MADMSEQEIFEYVRDLGTKVEKARENVDGTYVTNPINMARFNKVYDFFSWLVETGGGRVKILDVRPQSVHADISIEVPILDINGKNLEKFSEIIRCADIFGVTPTVSGSLLIDASVNNVWEVSR